MSESLEHQNYVKMIVEYVKSVIPEDTEGKICADLADFESPYLVYDTFIPDVMYSYNNMLIIGEAKTLEDFKREHSKNQYLAYVKECINYPGQAMIVIAIPWELFVTAKNHFRLLKKKLDKQVDVVIISSNGKKERI